MKVKNKNEKGAAEQEVSKNGGGNYRSAANGERNAEYEGTNEEGTDFADYIVPASPGDAGDYSGL